MFLQEHQQLLSAYQSLVVKQLLSRKQEEQQDEEARSVHLQLMALTPQVKELVLAPRKTSVTED